MTRINLIVNAPLGPVYDNDSMAGARLVGFAREIRPRFGRLTDVGPLPLGWPDPLLVHIVPDPRAESECVCSRTDEELGRIAPHCQARHWGAR